MRSLRMWVLLVACNTVGGCIPAVMAFLSSQHPSAASLWVNMQWGLPFSWCIGTLCFLLVEPASRYIRRMPRALQVPGFMLTFVALALVGAFLACLIFLGLGWLNMEELWPVYFQALRTAVLITVVLGSIVTGFEMLLHRLDAATLELRNRQLAEERARKLATEARLTSLESRVHPHFLFNTLNSISALIREDPRAAERTVERLAALLRDSLEVNRARLVPLSREVGIVQDYLEIERTRYGKRLRYSIDIPPSVGDPEVPPFSLQTLVENSVKHVVSARRDGAEIRVTARNQDGQLILEVSDDGPGFDRSLMIPGHGLDSLQDRLTTLFEGRGSLRTECRDGRCVVSIGVPA